MKKRILIYIHQSILKGGVEKVFYNLINRLTEEQYDITVLNYVAYLHGDLDYGVYQRKVKRIFFYYDEFSNNFIFKSYQRLYNKISKVFITQYVKIKNYDIAIAAQEGMYAKFIAGIRAKKKLLWIHNDMRICHWTGNYFNNSIQAERKCYEKFDKIVCVSKDVLVSMNEVFGDFHNICVKYNPIDTDVIEDKKDEEIKETVETRPLIVSIGRLVNQKGFDRLLKACNRLNKEGYSFSIWIIGEGEDRKKLEDYIFKNNLKNVKLLGNQINPFKYMNDADWIVCTSRHEGFNTVLQEAAYIGKPIITTDNAGAHELLGDNDYGIIVKNNDEYIYNGFKMILDNDNLKPYYEGKVKGRKAFINLKERIKSIEELFKTSENRE